jgi:sulfatase maturation enzyme AslB (radical SAM superfamily)
MTTVQITLPDELALKAANAGLLSPEAMEDMLREQLRRRAAEELSAMWQAAEPAQLTPEIEQEIVELVHEVRAKARKQGSN